MQYDVFNGDADGICALHQLRLCQPVPDRQLITGVKRDTNLLDRPELAEISGCSLTVFDVSLNRNAKALTALLQRRNTISYFDHHQADAVPVHPGLTAHIDQRPDTCTSLIVNDLIGGCHLAWAICGAFGDNLGVRALAEAAAFNPLEVAILREIGELLNYNGYGLTLDDLHYHPAELYKEVATYPDPFTFFHQSACIPTLRVGYRQDLDLAGSAQISMIGKNRLTILPDAPWARRISGTFANIQARKNSQIANCLITPNGDDTLQVSIRAPLAAPGKAGTLCQAFAGGGRPGAGGVNNLPVRMLNDFIDAFSATYP